MSRKFLLRADKYKQKTKEKQLNMKAKHFVLALILGLSIMGTSPVKADTGGGPQDGNDTRIKCPRGYIRDGNQCVRLPYGADPALFDPVEGSQPEGTDGNDYILTGIINGVLFYVFGTIG